MKKIFWDDPYQTELNTKVASVNGSRVLFEETIAYSFAGGQESDKGTVNGIPILDSKIVDHFIYYTLPEGHGLKPGDNVNMKIDWLRRNRLMRLHFAAELILEIVTQKYHLEKVGAHIAETKARIDFKSVSSLLPCFPEILEAYYKIIEADSPIEKGYTDEEKQRRYWRIEGFAQISCGGTHVRSTKEVGFVLLKRDRPGKGIERIEIKLIDDNPSS